MNDAPHDLVERLVEHGSDADDLLRATVATLSVAEGVSWAGIAFLEDGALRLGPAAGQMDEARRTRAPIVFQGAGVGELWIDGVVGEIDLERVATLIAPYVLIGWDTGGEAWDP